MLNDEEIASGLVLINNGESVTETFVYHVLQDILALKARLSATERALRSIATNTCCGPCQEAKSVALDGLKLAGFHRAECIPPYRGKKNGKCICGLEVQDA